MQKSGPPGEVYQIATMQALLDGVYDGDVPSESCWRTATSGSARSTPSTVNC